MAGLSIVAMLLSGIFPMAEYALPAMAGIMMIPIVIEYNKRTAWIAFGAVAILSAIITPNKQAVALFVAFLGYYPILKSLFEQVKSRVLEWVLKLILFNASVLIAYFVVINLLGMTDILSSFGQLGEYGVLIMLILGNVAFIVYDIAVTRLIGAYIHIVKPKLRIT